MMRDSPCYEATYSRLLQVPNEIFTIFSNYYSESDAANIYNLLMQGVIQMNRLTRALIDKDEDEAIKAMEQWGQNIIILSNSYAALNPYWSQEQWQSLLERDIQLTHQLVQAMVAGDCTRSLAIFGRTRSHAIVIGDYQARGIIRGLLLPDGFGQSEATLMFMGP